MKSSNRQVQDADYSSNDLVELENEFNKLSAEFNKKYQDFHSSKDENLKTGLKVSAQNVFGCISNICKRYETLIENLSGSGSISTNRIDEYKRKLEYFKSQKILLEKHLEKLNSPMSGIPDTSFNDIAGLDDVKETIKNYVFLLKNNKVAGDYGINTNLGILLYGPPGTGKTLMAEAIAHELEVRYFVITPSQIFGSYVGESEKNVRDVFAELNACKDGSVLLVDECESIFARRENNTNRAAIGVANQLLQEMNGQGQRGGKRIIIGATNRPELIDEAYLRFKRFSMQFYIGMPTYKAIEHVVDLNFKKHPLYEPMAKSYLLQELLSAKNMGRYTCADISGIIEKCAYLALQEYRIEKEKGNNLDYVKISADHIKKVLSEYRISVTKSMLQQYEQFKESHM